MANNGMRGMGWLPDVPSIKDFTETHPKIAPLLQKTRLRSRASEGSAGRRTRGGSGTAAAPAISTKVDLRADFSPIEDQQQIGSCTANAAVGLVEYFERKAAGNHIDASRLFVYKTTRNLLGMTGDSGAYLRSAMGALVLFGAPPEQYWPYDGRPEQDNTRLDEEPPAFCYAFGANYKTIQYMRLDPEGTTPEQVLQTIKTYLADGMPSMFGFPAYQEFMTPNSQAQVAFPKSNSHLYGGHAIVAAGYDDKMKIAGDEGALLIRNSWGTSWGDQGYAWMSYRYVTEQLALDWWTMIKEDWVDSGVF